MPETGFNCGQQQYLPGIYTDTAADCQVSLELLHSIWSDDLSAAVLHVRGERSLHSLPLPEWDHLQSTVLRLRLVN